MGTPTAAAKKSAATKTAPKKSAATKTATKKIAATKSATKKSAATKTATKPVTTTPAVTKSAAAKPTKHAATKAAKPTTPGSASSKPASSAKDASSGNTASSAKTASSGTGASSVKGAASAKAVSTAALDENGLGWLDAGKGYQLTLDDGKLAAKNPAGKRLASVPKDVKDSDAADQLEALRDWLKEHDKECLATVDQWMLRSLAVPRAVIEAVWDDPSWRAPLENAVVVALNADGGHDHAKAGLLRGADTKKGVGVVDLDGETAWLATDRVAIPHPILLPELDAWRELLTQIGATQGIAQLHRETHGKPTELAATASSVDDFEDGKFAMLMHAIGKARALGFKVRGGFATCKVWDTGGVTEARYWIGSDSPESETYTGQLSWVDGREKGLAIKDVGPVAFSEGMRMASSIYAARVVETKEDAS
ncbi:MAG: DUF4132 domain-containing protein [Kofleriaceae bacterium]